ncbi:MAG: hypothetical protein GY842_18525 [bacterium]|nr:hypothetical protein [bacterium]
MTTGCSTDLLRLSPSTRAGATASTSAPTASGTGSGRCCARVGPVEIELSSSLADAAEDFAALYRHWLLTPPLGPASIRIRVRQEQRTRWGAKRYTIEGDGERIFGQVRPEEVLPYVEWAINYRVIATRTEFLQLHAAVLAWRGNGVMLVGPSGSGKSTLTAALAARGWDYLSDEFALIDPVSLRAHAFPKALCIKSGSFALVRDLGLPLWDRRPYVKAFKGRVAYVSPHDVRTQTTPTPIRLIVFPQYTGGRMALHTVSRARTVFSLTANAFNPHLFGERLVEVLSGIAHGAQCVALEPGELDHTCNQLAKLID